MADEKVEAAKPAHDEAAKRPLNPTEQMHKFSADQIAEFQKANKAEREKKLADAKKEAEEIAARAARKHGQMPGEHTDAEDVV